MGKRVIYSAVYRLLEDTDIGKIAVALVIVQPSRRKAPVYARYSGFEIPDAFVVGYGLDYDERYRNLPYIGVLKESVYSK